MRRNDPYAAYADGVIASLGDEVSGGKVVGRANFVAQVRAWRANQKALEKAILERMSVSQAETSAFLNAQNKVTAYLQTFMDASGWLKDAPVPQDVRAEINGPLKNLYGVLADQLQDALNIWEAKWYPESNLFFDTIRAFSEGMDACNEIADQYVDTMKSIVHGASRIAIGFVPFVGPAVDICEAVTGKEFCMPSGRELTTGERVWSGLGFGIGKAVKVWKGVSTAAISAEGKATAATIVSLRDEVVNLLRTKRLAKWRNLGLTHGDFGDLSKFANDFERKAAIYLMKDQGHQVLASSDLAIRKLLGLVEGRACDFLTVSKTDGLILSEAKSITSEIGQVNTPKALEQLNSVVAALAKKNLAKDIERVQIITTFPGTFKGGFIPKEGKLFNTNTKQFEIVIGRPGLYIHVVEL